MPKPLFDDESDDDEVSLKTENKYAKQYDAWRQKEELHKLEQKYGSKGMNSDVSETSSEDESDEPPEVSEEMEAQFLKTLALLKTKDQRIYDPSFKCFDAKPTAEDKGPKQETKSLVFADSDDESDNDGNIFSIEKKAVPQEDNQNIAEKPKKGGKIKEYLTGKAEHIDEDIEKDLAPLKALWSDPKLNDGEAFLRDYILNQRYLEEGDAGQAADKIRDDEALEADERLVEEQGQFERAYNFRFEEPDQEYLKRYPRTMNHIRPKDDRRSRHRAELRERKLLEKTKRMEEIARLKALKLKEIRDKLEKIKEVTGNEDLAFKEEDLEGDFDPSEHDRRMRAMFDDTYYGDAAADQHKPEFPELDDELEIENWETYEEEEVNKDEGPHCEDEDFNMDADYDPKQAKKNLLEEIRSNLDKKRRNRKKKSKLAAILAEEKPKYVPTVADKTYDQYMEEYYKMDCEDVIGDLPTRFKYREVVPNDYGLSIEEILLADDKELTQWVPLKKIIKHKPETVQRGEVNAYRQKAADKKLKKKILPSLFSHLPEEPEIVVPIETATKKKKKKNKKKSTEVENPIDTEENTEETTNTVDDTGVKLKKNKDRSKEIDFSVDTEENIEKSNTSEDSQVISNKKSKKKHKDVELLNGTVENGIEERNTLEQCQLINKKKHTKSKLEYVDNVTTSEELGDKNISVTNNKEVKKNNEVLCDIEQAVAESAKTIDNINASSDKKSKRKKHKKYAKSNSLQEETNIEVDNKKQNSAMNPEDAMHSKKKKKHTQNIVNLNESNFHTPSKNGNTLEVNLKINKNNNQGNKSRDNLKRKFDGGLNNDVQFKKKKNKMNKIFKQNDKNRDSQETNNPLSKLSDERLKAYGLNPKKYRSFLKYKKF